MDKLIKDVEMPPKKRKSGTFTFLGHTVTLNEEPAELVNGYLDAVVDKLREVHKRFRM